ncbi:MAG TPA: hypothetical protein VNL38_01490 [Candidatus Nitrosotenuis sp.]|nr:hypothetical protein [Candidatus Nitrosotenuis sp.]
MTNHHQFEAPLNGSNLTAEDRFVALRDLFFARAAAWGTPRHSLTAAEENICRGWANYLDVPCALLELAVDDAFADSFARSSRGAEIAEGASPWFVDCVFYLSNLAGESNPPFTPALRTRWENICRRDRKPVVRRLEP